MNDTSANDIITDNFILRSLPADEADALKRSLKWVEMPHGKILYEPDDKITHIYFPSTAMISIVAATADGHSVEAAVVGWDGLAGLEALLGHSSSVQLEGEGHRADLSSVQRQFAAGGKFQRMVLMSVREKMVEMAQTGLCNRVHLAEKRLAKWLLMCHDRSPSDVMGITQEFAALMLGSNRVSVTQAAGQLQDHKLIKYNRGRMQVIDREGLEQYACECYARVSEELHRLTGGSARRGAITQ